MESTQILAYGFGVWRFSYVCFFICHMTREIIYLLLLNSLQVRGGDGG